VRREGRSGLFAFIVFAILALGLGVFYSDLTDFDKSRIIELFGLQTAFDNGWSLEKTFNGQLADINASTLDTTLIPDQLGSSSFAVVSNDYKVEKSEDFPGKSLHFRSTISANAVGDEKSGAFAVPQDGSEAGLKSEPAPQSDSGGNDLEVFKQDLLPTDGEVRGSIAARSFVSLVPFDFDSAELLGGAEKFLVEALDEIHNRENSFVSLTGYSDNKGDQEYNLELSRRRATSVADYLESRGVAKKRIKLHGGGVYEKLYDVDIPDEIDVRSPGRMVLVEISDVAE
jgi:outer membrane protein OmpA-like peptidoglycan-associated protein